MPDKAFRVNMCIRKFNKAAMSSGCGNTQKTMQVIQLPTPTAYAATATLCILYLVQNIFTIIHTGAVWGYINPAVRLFQFPFNRI